MFVELNHKSSNKLLLNLLQKILSLPLSLSQCYPHPKLNHTEIITSSDSIVRFFLFPTPLLKRVYLCLNVLRQSHQILSLVHDPFPCFQKDLWVCQLFLIPENIRYHQKCVVEHLLQFLIYPPFLFGPFKPFIQTIIFSNKFLDNLLTFFLALV